MKARRNDRSQQAANYFDQGFRALFQQYAVRLLTPEQFMEKMNELKEIAETNCRKDIINAFDMGFKHGVKWIKDMEEEGITIPRSHGIEYYQNVYEGGNYDT